MLRSLRLAVLTIPLLGLGCFQIQLFAQRGPLVESVVHGAKGPKLLLVDIDGVIDSFDTSSLFGQSEENMVARVRETLDMARRAGDLRGILLRVDTPGGSAAASEMIYTELLRFKRESSLPVVAHFMGTATSGGYYVAMVADEINAEHVTVTGSIGVIFFNLNFSGLMDRYGVRDETITGGVHKDAGSPFRPMTDPERAHIQSVTDDLHRRFKDVVIEGRPRLGMDKVERLADGSIYSAPQALENGLIDSIGSIEDAIKKLETRAGLSSSVVVSYHRQREWRQNLYTRGPLPEPSTGSVQGVDLPGLIPQIPSGFHYLWLPGAR